MRLITFILLSVFCRVFAVELTDFVPAFLMPLPESANIPVKPLVEAKRNGSSASSWYCNRNHSVDSQGNIFCNKNSSNATLTMPAYESSFSDKTKIIDNSVSGVKIGQATSANQSTLQNQNIKNELQKYNNSLLLPISPSDNVKMNINQQQVQFNIKY